MRVAVIGGGGWGTTLAILLHGRGHEARLWVYEGDLAARMRDRRENDTYLPGVTLPEGLRVTSSLPDSIASAAR